MGSDAALTSAIADYLSFAAIEKGLSKNTIAAYRLDLAGFSEFMAGGGKTIEDVSPVLMEDFLGWLRGANSTKPRGSESSISRNIVCVRNLFKFIATDGTYKGVFMPTCFIALGDECVEALGRLGRVR